MDRIVEIVAAGLVAAEIVILFGGVVSRYVFDRPLVWSDELASTLFLWLAMLGAVIAFRRDEHMRMTACVGMLPPPRRAALDTFATGAALAFLLLIAWPTYQYALYRIADHDLGAGNHRCLARRRHAGRHRFDDRLCGAAAVADRPRRCHR